MRDVKQSFQKNSKETGTVDPLIGRMINERFRVVSLMARGGMGKVYRAEQAPLGREVALKVLNPNYEGDHDIEFHKRFFLEASTCAKLTHPNTVTIFDYGKTEDDIYYIAMELLEGRTLYRTLRDEGRLNADRALHIARQVCRSLREAHDLGVVHRDLKPANIFLIKHGDEKDFVKVLDFGLVKHVEDKEDLTQTGVFMGSPKYMSPEQIREDTTDERSDIYALGVILYEMLTGVVPFNRPNSMNILMAHIHDDPPPFQDIAPDLVDPRLEQIVMKAIAKDPEMRFANMDEFLITLKQAAIATGMSLSTSGETKSGEFTVGGSTGAFPTVSLENQNLEQETPSSESQSAPQASLDTSHTDSSATSSQGSAIAVIVAVLILAASIGGILAMRDRYRAEAASIPPPSHIEETPISAPPVAPTSESAEPTQENLALEEPFVISITSTPSGAAIFIDEQNVGVTPVQVERTGSEATPGQTLTFRFQYEGYRDLSITRTIAHDALDIDVELQQAQTAIKRSPRRPLRERPTTSTEAMSDSPPTGLKGYKAQPY